MSRKTTNRAVHWIAGLGILLTLTLVAVPAAAKSKTEVIEAYKGNVLVQQAGAGGSSLGEFRVYRWSTDEERDTVLAAIKSATEKANANREVASSLRGLEKAGYVFLTAQIGYPIRFTREFKMPDGSRQIVMATDRPVTFQEAYTASQAGDFDVSIIILKLDEDGKGEGVISVGTELVWDEDKQKIALTNASSQPVMVTNVRPAN